jgi:hypothetical protein
LGAYEKKTILDEAVFILFLCYIARGVKFLEKRRENVEILQALR